MLRPLFLAYHGLCFKMAVAFDQNCRFGKSQRHEGPSPYKKQLESWFLAIYSRLPRKRRGIRRILIRLFIA